MSRGSRTIEVDGQTNPVSTRLLPFLWGAFAIVTATTCGMFGAAVPLRYALLLHTCAGPRCQANAAYTVGLDIVTALVWLAMALLVFWRRPGDLIGLFTALTLLTFGVGRFPDTPLALAATHPSWWLPVEALRFLGSACLSIFVFIFPDGHFAPPITRVIAGGWILIQIPEFFLTSSAASADTWSPALRFVGFLGFTLVVVAAQAWRYWRVSSFRQRQQTRWVVFGFGSSLVCYLAFAFAYPLLASVGVVSAPPQVVSTLTSLTFLFIPISLAIAVVRHNLYDIDILINRALVYGSLTASLAAIYLASVFALQVVVMLVTGAQHISSLVIVCSTLAVAALFQPVRRMLQRQIDRRFYRHKYNASATIAAFSASLRQELDLAQLQQRLIAITRETMQPTHASLWLRPVMRQDADPQK